MRLFIGIDLGHPEYFSRLQEPLRSVKGARMTFQSYFHLTLQFIGDTDEPVKNKIQEALRAIQFSVFTLCCDHIGAFPSSSQARVVWAGFAGGPGSGSSGAPFKEGYGHAVSLAKQVEKMLKEIGIQGPEQEFMPHVTLARVKTAEGRALSEVKDRVAGIQVPTESFKVASFSLIKSTLGQEGPAYEILATYPARF